MRRITILLAMVGISLLAGCNEAENKTSVKVTHKPLMTVEKVDADFIATAHDIISAEITAGKMAMVKGTDKRIKNYGRIMVKDYTKAAVKLDKFAVERRIPLPDRLSIMAKNKISHLSSKTGGDFDNAYIDYITADHKNAILIFEQAQKNCFDKNVKSIAQKGVLVFKRHLEAVFAIRDSMH